MLHYNRSRHMKLFSAVCWLCSLEFVLSFVLALQAVSSSQAEPLYCDFAFVIGDECILLHRALLAARSKYFKHMLTSQWQPKVVSMRI